MLKHIQGPYGSFDAELLERCDALSEYDNLTQAILHAHLLIEQALNRKLEKKFAKPEVLRNKKYAQLSFAQKAALYVGLYAPDAEAEGFLLGFNRLRNMIAHQFLNDTDLVYQCLPVLDGAPASTPLLHVKACFGYLAFFELDAVHGTQRMDVEDLDDTSDAP